MAPEHEPAADASPPRSAPWARGLALLRAGFTRVGAGVVGALAVILVGVLFGYVFEPRRPDRDAAWHVEAVPSAGPSSAASHRVAAPPPTESSEAPPPDAGPVVAVGPRREPVGGVPAIDLASLPPDVGYLVVVGPPEARVFVGGTEQGGALESLPVRCGERHVRLGVRGDGGPVRWLGPSRSVNVGCQRTTRIEPR